MISNLLLLISALACVWWMAIRNKDPIMLTLHASANDIERALNELHHLASQGEGTDAREAASLLLALWDSDRYPLNLQDFQYLCPMHMQQSLRLFVFLMTTGTPLKKFISDEAMTEVETNLARLCQQRSPGLLNHSGCAQTA